MTYRERFFGTLLLMVLMLGVSIACSESLDVVAIDLSRFEDTETAIAVKIGLNKIVKANITKTARGNGHLEIGKLKLKIIDNYDDGAKYMDGSVHIDFEDLNDDGFNDMIISGIVCYTHEKQDIVVKHEDCVFIYMYSPSTDTFVSKYRRASFSLESGPEAIKPGAWGHEKNCGWPRE